MDRAQQEQSSQGPCLSATLLTGGADRPYAFGLATALIAHDIPLDIIAGDELASPEFLRRANVNFLNLRGDQRQNAPVRTKIARVLAYYLRLIRYALFTKVPIFHILWNNKFEWFDRTILMLFYRARRKKIVLTVHNVNAGWRDETDTWLNHATLKAQYRLAHHLFVHTEKMKSELGAIYGVNEAAITVIPFGLNNAVPQTTLTPHEARVRLGFQANHKILLFFGSIAPYKGLEYLVAAFQMLATSHPDYRLIIAGSPKKGFEAYWNAIRERMRGDASSQTVEKIEFISDEHTELYFKAADVLILPYTEIFQSGVLFLGYSFGLPVLAADVGSLKGDIVPGRTGYVFSPKDPVDLARAVESYFSSELFHELPARRLDIIAYARDRYSWDSVVRKTQQVYAELLGAAPACRS
jgi:glycosyltransferase involved in cell wall biosynthesis